MLGIAAREADIVGVNPSLAAGHVGAEVLATTTAEYYDQRIAWVREAAGDRFDDLELQCLTFLVQIVPDREDAVERLASMMSVTRRAGGRLAHRPHRHHRADHRAPGRAAGALRLLLRRRPRGGDGGVRPGGGGPGRHLRWPRPARGSGSSGARSTRSTRATSRWPRRSAAALGLDRMLVVVANEPWQKQDRPVTPAEDRFAMVAAALGDRPGLEASRIEIDRGGPSYTVDTVRTAARPPSRAPRSVVVVGADVVADLDTWHDHEALRGLVTLAVVDRPGRTPRSTRRPGGGRCGSPVDPGRRVEHRPAVDARGRRSRSTGWCPRPSSVA